jgi:hypothetical protein
MSFFVVNDMRSSVSELSAVTVVARTSHDHRFRRDDPHEADNIDCRRGREHGDHDGPGVAYTGVQQDVFVLAIAQESRESQSTGAGDFVGVEFENDYLAASFAYLLCDHTSCRTEAYDKHLSLR